jgi:hypothetical protein
MFFVSFSNWVYELLPSFWDILLGFIDWFYGLPLSVWAILLLGCMITPGMMFVVAGIGESRRLLVWRGQSRMFFPGDIGLAFVLAGIMLLTQELKLRASVLSVAAAGFAGIVVPFVMMFIADGPRYPKRSRRSPTKLYHDIVCYGGYLFILLASGLNVVWTTFQRMHWSSIALPKQNQHFHKK